MQTDSLCKTPLQAKTHPLFFTKQMAISIKRSFQRAPTVFYEEIAISVFNVTHSKLRIAGKYGNQ